MKLNPYARHSIVILLIAVALFGVFKIAQATAILVNVDIPSLGGTSDFTISLDSGTRTSAVTGKTVNWVRNTVTNKLSNSSYNFDWRTGGPAGFSGNAGSGITGTTPTGTSAAWEWEASSAIYSIGCSTTVTNPLPSNFCLRLDPNPITNSTPTANYRVPGRSLSSSGVTTTTGSITTTYLQAFSPLRPAFQLTSAVRELTNGQFEYTTSVHNLSNFGIRFVIAASPLGCDAVTCDPPQENCGNVCVNTCDNLNNCGSCGIVCASGEYCSNGICYTNPAIPTGSLQQAPLLPLPEQVVCKSYERVCADTCVSLCGDSNNCGSCGNVCPTGFYCGNGTCQEQITINQGALGEATTLPQPEQTGSGTCEFPIGCDPPCPTGYGCVAGECQPIITVPSSDGDGSGDASQDALDLQPALLERIVEVPPGGFARIDCSIEDVPAKEIPTLLTATCGAADGGCALGAQGVSGPAIVFVPDRTMTPGEAFLTEFRTEFKDASGNGIVEPGEAADLFVYLINARGRGLQRLAAHISDKDVDLDCQDQENGQCLVPGGDVATDPILITRADSAYPDIPGANITGGSLASCSDTNEPLNPVPVRNSTSFTFSVPRDHPENTAHPVTMMLTGRLAGSDVPYDINPITFTVPVGRTCVPGGAPNDFDTLQGFLSPLTRLVLQGNVVPMPDSPFKLGSVLPMKLRFACGSMFLTNQNATPPRIVGLARNGVPINLATLNSDAGNSNSMTFDFRYDVKMAQWVYNLASKGQLMGTYVVTIQMPNGQNYDAGFRLIQ